MAAAHRGHIICLFGGRAIYIPKSITIAQTLREALDSFGLDRRTAAHFGFPHADLAIMVEIGAAAFHNVRDGAILYLCTGAMGPVFPHELARHAHAGMHGGDSAHIAIAGNNGVRYRNQRRGRYLDDLVNRREGDVGAADEEDEDVDVEEEDWDDSELLAATAPSVPAKKSTAKKPKKTASKVFVTSAAAASPAKGQAVKREREEEEEEVEAETSSAGSSSKAKTTEPYSKRLRRGGRA